MGELVEKLGNKSDGGLIKSDDWNSLVRGIEAVETKLDDRIDALESTMTQRFQASDERISDLENRVNDLSDEIGSELDTVKADIADLKDALSTLYAEIAPIYERCWSLYLESPKQQFALGEKATIRATVKDFRGDTLGERPWVDFVSVWGRLRPAPGFTSRAGAGNRNLSVQVNDDGIAEVYLSSEHADGFTEEAENEVLGALRTKVPSSDISIADTILSAETPMQAKETGAFRLVRNEYDRTGALSVRNFVDAYYMKNQAIRNQKIIPNFYHTWRDYRATVLAFVKKDADPGTPDQSRGVSSIQITFRDWIGPWLSLDYFQELDTLLSDYRGRLGSRTVITDNLPDSLRNIQDEVLSITDGKGVVGKQRDYKAINKAVGTLDMVDPPSFVSTLAKTVRGAIGVQRMLETTQAHVVDADDDENAAMDAFTNTATQSEKDYTDVKDKLSSIENVVNQMDEKVKTVDSGVQILEERTQSIQNESGSFRSDIVSLKGDLTQLSKLDMDRVSETISRADVLWKDRLGLG